jgi:hypothetical protein
MFFFPHVLGNENPKEEKEKKRRRKGSAEGIPEDVLQHMLL